MRSGIWQRPAAIGLTTALVAAVLASPVSAGAIVAGAPGVRSAPATTPPGLRTTPAVGKTATFTTKTTVLPKASVASVTQATTPQAGLFVAPIPVSSLASLVGNGGAVVSVDTGHFGTSGHLDAAAVICNSCPSPYPAPFQNQATGQYSVVVLPGNGDGTFGTATQLTPVGANVALSMILATDVGNGHPDLVVAEGASTGTSQLLVYLGNGTGTFQSPPIAIDSPEPLAMIQAANLGDGHVDVVGLAAAGDTSHNEIVVFTGDGTGHFTPGTPIPLPNGYVTDLVVAPLANGGKPDILATAYTGSKANSLSVLVNNGSGGFPATPTNPDAEIAGPEGMEVGNFDGAANPPDVLLAGASCTIANASPNNNCQVLLPGNGDGTFQIPTIANTVPIEGASRRGPEDDAPFDLNGDGVSDALWAPTYDGSNTQNGIVQVALGAATGGFKVSDVIGTAAGGAAETMVLPADLSGDSHPDLIVGGWQQEGTSDSPGLWVVPANTTAPGTFTTGQGYLGASSTGQGGFFVTNQLDEDVAVGDFAKRGIKDIVTTGCSSVNQGTCQDIDVDRLPGNGDGTFGTLTSQTFTVSEGFYHPFGLVAGDFNGDGNLDVVTLTNGGLEYLLGNGDGTFQAPVFVAANNSNVNYPSCCEIHYTTLNGVPDVVAQVLGNGGQFLESWLWNSTTKTFNAPVVSLPLPQLSSTSGDFAIAHFDSTDAVDVVTMVAPSGGSGAPPVEVITGNSDGSFNVGTPTVVGDACPTTGALGAVAAGDLGNGHDDVLWQCDSSLFVALGDGTGAFAAPQSYGEGQSSSGATNNRLLLADLEGNGHLDAVAYGADNRAPGLNVWHNNGDRTFATSSSYSAGNQMTTAVATAAALTSAGTDDLITVNNFQGDAGDQMTVLLGTGGRPSLEATSVSGPTPATPAPGNIVTGTYTVADTGGPVNDAWADSVYLAPGSTGTAWSSAETLVERVPQTQTLAGGATYGGQFSFPLGNVAPGTYHFIVVPDSGDVLSGGNETPAASAPFTVGPIPTLAVGSPIATSIQAGQTLYYQVAVTSAADVQVSVAGLGAPGDVTIYGENGQVPAPQTATAEGAAGSVNLPSSNPGTWFVVIEPASTVGTSPTSITVSATNPGLTFTTVSPGTVDIPVVRPVAGCAGTVTAAVRAAAAVESCSEPPTVPPIGDGSTTLTLQGSDFGPDLAVSLVNGTTTYTATTVTRRDSTVAFASFPIASVCGPLPGCGPGPIGPGTYDVEVMSGGNSITIPHGLVIGEMPVQPGVSVSSPPGALAVTIGAPATLRNGWIGELSITMTNRSSSDIAVPVIDVSSADAMLGAPGVSDPAQFVPDLELDDPVLSADRLLDPAPPGILPAGTTVTLDVGVLADPGDPAHTPLTTTTTLVNSTDTTTVDWTSQLAGAQPSTISNSSWSTIVADFGSDMGATEGRYAIALLDAFNEARVDGVTLGNEAEALNFLVTQEVATGAGAPVSGTLHVGDTSHPLGNVAVTLSGPGGLFDATSWYDGRFNFWDVPPGSYQMDVDGYVPRPARTVSVAPTATGLSVVVDSAATVTGQVTNSATTVPVSGAEVIAADAEGSLSATTDVNGTYMISGLAPGIVTVQAEAPGLVSSPAVTLTAAAGSNNQPLMVGPGGAISGTVAAPPGGQLTTDAVSALPVPSGAPIPGSVSPTGAFTIDGLAPGSYDVVATQPGSGPGSASGVIVATVGSTVTGVALELTQGVAISGVVTDTDSGAPLGGVTVASNALGATPVSTDASGTYTLSGLPPTTQTLRFTEPDASHVTEQLAVSPADGSTIKGENATLDPTGTITAALSGPGGPLANTEVVVVGPSPATTLQPVTSHHLTTDATGTASTTGLAPGTYDVQVPGADAHSTVSIATGNRTPTVHLTIPVGQITGEVEVPGGVAAPGVYVSLADSNGLIALAQTDAGGHYSFPVTAGGPEDVVVNDPSVGLHVAHVTADPTATTTATLEGGTASLTVNVANGAGAVPGAAVTLNLGGVYDGPASLDLLTDATGAATFQNLAAGTYSITVEDGTDAAATAPVTLTTGQVGSASVTLRAGGSIAATLDDDHGKAVPGATVTAVGTSNHLRFATTTAADGAYALGGLPGDTYDVTATNDVDVPAVQNGVAVTAGSTAAGPTTLETSGDVLSVQLATDGSGGPLPAGQLTVLDADGIALMSTQVGPAVSGLDAPATATIGPLAPSASYTLTFNAAGSGTSTQSITMSSSPTSTTIDAGTGEVLPTPVATPTLAAAVRPAGFPTSDSITQIIQVELGNLTSPATRADSDNASLLARYQADINASPGPCGNVADLQALIRRLWAEKEQEFSAWQAAVYGLNVAGNADVGLLGVELLQDVGAVANLVASLVTPFDAVMNSINSSASDAQVIAQIGATENFQKVANLIGSNGSLLGTIIQLAASPPSTPSEQLADAASLFVTVASLITAIPGIPGGAATAAANLLTSLWSTVNQVNDTITNLGRALDPVMEAENLYRRSLISVSGALSSLEAALKNSTDDCLPPPPPPPYPPPPGPNQPNTNPYDLPQTRGPNDPNELTGPAGDGSPAQYIKAGSSLPYTIQFQNTPTASAPATEVFVTMPVPPHTDPSSIQLTGFGFGKTSVPLNDAGMSFSQLVTGLGLANGDDVSVAGSYDPGTNTITWTLEAINPATGDVDATPTGGFLPPDDVAGDGEGYVSFQVNAVPGLAAGTTIPAHASIVFDKNAPIATNTWTNTIDGAPNATVAALPATETGPFNVSWSGTAPGSAISAYDVYVSDNGGTFTAWQSGVTATSAQFTGTVGHIYAFVATAVDLLGNTALFPANAQAVTEVAAPSGGGGGGGGASPPPPSGPPGPIGDVTRIAGADRIATSIAASQDKFPQAQSAGAVVLARDDDFADALAGTPLAAAKGAPLLLTPTASLDPQVLNEIARVLPIGGTVYVLGGDSAVNASVASALTGGGFNVVRYGGADRYATAVTIAHLGLGDRPTILLATGLDFPDGLAAGPAAVVSGGAILLTDGTDLGPATGAYLAAHAADAVEPIGGPAAAADPTALPVVGADRYATAGLVAAQFFPTARVAGVATGAQFPDALSGGAEMAELGGPILLTDPTSLSPTVLTYLQATPTVRAVKVFGGSAAVADGELAQL